MKFLINKKEIKTVMKNASIEGSINTISRCARFSYVYSQNDKALSGYKAKINSLVEILNDEGEKIFIGNIREITYDPKTNTIFVCAYDLFLLLSETKITGRIRDEIIEKIKSCISKLKIDVVFAFINILIQKANVISFGNLTLYDILLVILSKINKEEFKLYMDGSKIKLLFPYAHQSVGDFVFGLNIISSTFSTKLSGNTAQITAIGNDKVVSGTAIRIIDPLHGIKGEFVVQHDRHIYSDTHTMELELTERRIHL